MATSSVIEVLIETLHGTAFELLVSPDDTVHSIKARISRLEGIPVSHQHLIWRDQELSDAASVRECEIRDGSAIKLVLGMRGGPINTRKASVDERPTLYEVAKYLDAKGEEGSLSIPKMRAMRMVVMREGDKVHLYTVVDRPLLREDLCLPHEPSPEEACDPVRRQENLLTRQKVDELQQRMRMCRLRKDEGGAQPPAALPPVQQQQPAPVFQGSRHWSNNSCWNRPPAAPRATTGLVLPQVMLPGPPGSLKPSGCHWRLPCQGVAGHSCQQQPPARPLGLAGAIPKERCPRFPPHAHDHCRKCTALLERMYGLDRRGGVEGWQCSSKQPSVVLSFGQMDVPSAAPLRTSPPRPDEGPVDPPRNFFKVGAGKAALVLPGECSARVRQHLLPPVGGQRRPQQQRRCCCVRPSRPAEQDVATLPVEPLELDWSLQRPRTAPTARGSLVRLPSLSPLPVSPDREAAPGPEPCCPLLDEEALDACKRRSPPGAAAALSFPGTRPLLSGPFRAVGAEGIRWALASSTVSRRAPLLQRVHEQLWRGENPFLRHTGHACWARLAADHQGDDPKEGPPPAPQGGPPTNGHPSNQDRNAASTEPAAAMEARGGGSSELSSSSGSGGPADEDSNSTSESKTDDGASSVGALHPSPGKAKKKGKRCSWCNKKTGLASTYVCRCGNIFCAAHRYAEAHACSHDYKAEGRYILQRNNPVVKAAKLPKI